LKRAERPNRIEVAKEKDGLGGFGRSTRAEAGFERVAVVLEPMQFDAAAELLEMVGSKGNASVYGGFRVGRRLGLHEFSSEIEE